MGNVYFTDEDLERLRKNPYVQNVSEKSIKYTAEFKEFFMKRYRENAVPSAIFLEAGFDLKALGKDRIHSFTSRVNKEAERVQGFEDQRKYSSGRPRTRDLTAEEKIERLELKNRLLAQENAFLKRVRSLNRKALSAASKTPRQVKSTD